MGDTTVLPKWIKRLLPAVLLLAAPTVGAETPAQAGCRAMAQRVAAYSGSGPVFLRSFEKPEVLAPLDEPALATTAFTYDNALAAIALVSCGKVAEAERIGEALRLAATSDRHWRDGRLRNAYRAGPVESMPLPPGWYDKAAGRWAEDPHQVGTSTGNVAWAALALLTLHEATGKAPYRDAAAGAMLWVVNATRDPSGPGGFAGGFHGFEPAPDRLGWKSTEHNLDAAAALDWLARSTGEARWREPAREARAFLDAMWDAKGESGRFLIGTLPDGRTKATERSGLDAQLWPILGIADAPAGWRRALEHAERAHGVSGGYDFNDDRDGLWVEGTAQAALSWRAAGDGKRAGALLAELARHVSPHGLLFATREPRITTGLALGPASTNADFFYYRHPHLGATAWAVLAAQGWNPFTGKRL
ncbi:MAG TPA: hypothetical protein VED40_19650 [Azospirillaceae bacterium]|nr:hypothetical protein [Azospirillaceae bacterium]